MCKSSSFMEWLPPELLTIIFSYVHEDSRSLFKEINDRISAEKRLEMNPEKPDILKRSELTVARSNAQRYLASSSCFPFAPAAVFNRWRNVLCCSPAFWEQVVWFIDSNPTSVEEAKAHLARTRGLPIDITITRREDLITAWSEARERARVWTFMDILLPEAHRWRSLHIDVASSSSLPIIATEFTVKAPLLQLISFNCERDRPPTKDNMHNGYQSYLNRVALSMDESFPVLTVLVLDGLNFAYCCEERRFWVGLETKLEQLAVINYRPGVVLDKVTVVKAFERISSVTTLLSLKFVNVRFAPPRPIYPDDPPFVPFDIDFVEDLVLDTIDPEPLLEIFERCIFHSLHFLHIARCPDLPIGLLGDLDQQLRFLSFDDLPPTVNLEGFVTDLRSRALFFANCPLVSDSFLEYLTRYKDVATQPGAATVYPGGRRFACPNLNALIMHHCKDFSVESMKNTIEKRRFFLDAEGPPLPVMVRPDLQFVFMKGCIQDRLSEEDLAWFKKQVPEFAIEA
ncbi:unnamed protein product [Cyclocybe aegerita]|uniref:F-box domain-containing protein n=1 Tax=Cyclocybe aegerita TaxID=1973307 RepID=A0A8S0XT21_CYCAE|nr:unnamed protein product [Cyclocybe aegerita]